MSRNDSVVPIEVATPWSESQRACLNALLDLMIPASADGRMPAASALGLFDRPGDLPDKVRVVLGAGLDRVASAAGERFGKPLARLAPAQALAFVTELRAGAAPFFAALTAHTVARYYQHDLVMTRLGLEPRPPWPQGHAIDEGDWSLLERVRERGAVYREV